MKVENRKNFLFFIIGCSLGSCPINPRILSHRNNMTIMEMILKHSNDVLKSLHQQEIQVEELEYLDELAAWMAVINPILKKEGFINDTEAI